MKNHRFIILFTSSVFAFLSCNRESAFTPHLQVEKTLTIEAYNAEIEAKNTLDESGNVLWNPHDTISVFFGDYSVPFLAYNTKPATRANFIGTVLVTTGGNAEYDESSEDYIYWGIYPYQTHHFKYVPSKYDGGVACFVDESQTAVEGTFDRSTFVTVARSSDYSRLAFYNLCGGVRFKLSSPDIEMVTFTGNNNEALAGEVVVDMDADGHPYAKKHYSEIKTVRLSAPEGTTFKPGVWYYLVSLPAELSSGFTMKFISRSKSKMAVLNSDSHVKIERSHFGSLDCPDANLEYSPYDGSEENEQLRNEMYIKSVKMAEDESFSIEIGYPTIAAQKVFEKMGFKVEKCYIDPSSEQYGSNDVGKISNTLYKVGISYSGYDYEAYYKLSIEEQYLYEDLRYHMPTHFFYSSKSHTFISVDTSDKELYSITHRYTGTYLGTCGDNNYFYLPPYGPSPDFPSMEGNKIYNIVDGEDELVIQEWGDFNTITDTEYYGHSNDKFLWLIDGLCPAVLCLQNQRYNFAVFPEKGVMRSITLPETYSFFSDDFYQVGNQLFVKFYNKETNKYGICCLRMNNGYPVIGDITELGSNYWTLSPQGTESLVLYDPRHSGCTSYYRLNPDGSIKKVLTYPGLDANDLLLCSGFSYENDYVINLVEEDYDFMLYKHDLATATTKDLFINLLWSGPLLRSCKHYKEYNKIYATYDYLFDGQFFRTETFIINCDTMTYSMEDGYVLPSDNTK